MIISFGSLNLFDKLENFYCSTKFCLKFAIQKDKIHTRAVKNKVTLYHSRSRCYKIVYLIKICLNQYILVHFEISPCSNKV
jgi:hypothetical protein